MRKGIPVVDLCIFAGDNAPVKLLTYRLPEIPEGYDFDVCTADALIKRMKARDGRIVLPDGMSYQMLVVQRNGDVTLEALRHIASLVEQGVPLYGPKPLRSGSLKDAGNAEEYAKLADRLWGGEMAASGSHAYGKGTVYWGMSLEEALAQAGIRPDIVLKSGNTPKDKVYFAHRQLADAEVSSSCIREEALNAEADILSCILPGVAMTTSPIKKHPTTEIHKAKALKSKFYGTLAANLTKKVCRISSKSIKYVSHTGTITNLIDSIFSRHIEARSFTLRRAITYSRCLRVHQINIR